MLKHTGSTKCICCAPASGDATAAAVLGVGEAAESDEDADCT